MTEKSRAKGDEMKKIGILLLLGLAGAVNGEVLLSENWEGGIDGNKWQAFGSPASTLYTNAAAMGTASFDNNGDHTYTSGVVSKDTYTLAPNLKVTFYSNMHADGVGTRDPWQFNTVYFSNKDLTSFGDSVGDFQWLYGPGIMYHGGSPAYGSGTEYYRDGNPTWVLGENMQGDTSDFSEWIKFSFVTQTDGSVQYFKNDSLVFTTDAGYLDYSQNINVRLVVSGRSDSTVALLDNVELQQVVPEPASVMLIGLGSLIITAYRKLYGR